MTWLQLLKHDRSFTAMMGWILPFLTSISVLTLLGVGSYGAYHSRHYRLTYDKGGVVRAVAYGTVLDVEVDNTRVALPCEDAYVDRRVVLYRPGTKVPAVTMLIPERGIANPALGHRHYHLILSLPAPIKPGAEFVYQSQQHDNCGMLQTIFANNGNFLGNLLDQLASGKDMAAPDTPITVSSTPMMEPALDLHDAAVEAGR